MIKVQEQLDLSDRHLYILEGHQFATFKRFVAETKLPFTQHKCQGGFRRMEIPIGTNKDQIERMRYQWIEYLSENPPPHENRLILEMAEKVNKEQEYKNSVLLENVEFTHPIPPMTEEEYKPF